MSVRAFKVGDTCIHNGCICRVDAIEKVYRWQATGVKVEVNPDLYLTALFGAKGDPAKNPKQRKVCSGYVVARNYAIRDLEDGILVLQKKLSALKSLAEQDPS